MNGLLLYGEKHVDYAITRNPFLLKKIRIHVHPNACVEVEAPEDYSLSEVGNAVRKRARWICNRLDVLSHVKKHALPREYVSGESHFYIGRRYCLKVIESIDGCSDVKLKGGCIEVTTRVQDRVVIRRRLHEWYRIKSEHYFQKRLQRLIDSIDWISHTPKIKIATMQKQWGSCSPDGVIHLNPWLIRASTDCIDYVIVHELCHLQERNHSKAYYALLTKHYPNWQHIKGKLDGMAELLLSE